MNTKYFLDKMLNETGDEATRNNLDETYQQILKAVSKKLKYIIVIDKQSKEDKFVLGVMSSNLLNVVKETMKDKKVDFDATPKNIYISVE